MDIFQKENNIPLLSEEKEREQHKLLEESKIILSTIRDIEQIVDNYSGDNKTSIEKINEEYIKLNNLIKKFIEKKKFIENSLNVNNNSLINDNNDDEEKINLLQENISNDNEIYKKINQYSSDISKKFTPLCTKIKKITNQYNNNEYLLIIDGLKPKINIDNIRKEKKYKKMEIKERNIDDHLDDERQKLLEIKNITNKISIEENKIDNLTDHQNDLMYYIENNQNNISNNMDRGNKELWIFNEHNEFCFGKYCWMIFILIIIITVFILIIKYITN